MPYSNLPPSAFWRLCREDREFRLRDIYRPKFRLTPGMRVATAGSCFAQNIGRYVRSSKLVFVDTEPAPAGMLPDTAERFGFGLYSARYGNVYTARQLRQLLDDAWSERVDESAIWTREGRFFDGLRPNTEPEGFASAAELRTLRLEHLARVRQIFDEADVFIFTLGLTEAWLDRKSGVVFPTAPGVVAGAFDPKRHGFVNFGMADTLEDLAAAVSLMRRARPALKILFTVSPVPLTATASGAHVLAATTYSKSVLRAVAGELAMLDPGVDYFPSYEIITGAPFGARHYKDNLRHVTKDGVATAMSVFFAAHPGVSKGEPGGARLAPTRRLAAPAGDNRDVCEEAMLDAFGAA